jgi:hypothetical protein
MRSEYRQKLEAQAEEVRDALDELVHVAEEQFHPTPQPRAGECDNVIKPSGYANAGAKPKQPTPCWHTTVKNGLDSNGKLGPVCAACGMPLVSIVSGAPFTPKESAVLSMFIDYIGEKIRRDETPEEAFACMRRRLGLARHENHTLNDRIKGLTEEAAHSKRVVDVQRGLIDELLAKQNGGKS